MIGNTYVLLDDKGREGSFVKTFESLDTPLFQGENRKGWGVYCSVNDFDATDEQKKTVQPDGTVKKITRRNIKFLSKINGIFADLDIAKKGDGQTREEKEAKKDKLAMEIMMKLLPSTMVSTSNGLQPVRRLKDSDTSLEYQIKYIKTINSIITRSKTVGASGDEVKDVTRILRVPGYYHMKEEPYMVTEIYAQDIEYTIEEIAEVFKERAGDPKPLSMIVPSSNFTEKPKNLQYSKIDSLNFVDVIERAFRSVGRTVEFDKQDRLVIDGRLTGTFIGKKGDHRYLASTSHEPFKGNTVTAVSDILSTSPKEAYKRILDEFKIGEESELRKQEKIEEKKHEVIESVETNFKHIPYSEKTNRGVKELLETDPHKILKRGWDEWDDLLGGIYGGKIYLIGANTGVGKSTFINQVCRNVSRTGHRVVKYSLEDRMEDSSKEELFYEVNKLRFSDKQEKYTRVRFVNNEYGDSVFESYVRRAAEILSKENIIELDKGKQVSIDELVLLMEEECTKGTKLFAIDHLHYFEWDGGTDRLDLHIQNVMHRINEIARKNNVAVFLVAHYRNGTKTAPNERPDPSWFKDGASIKQVANIIIQIERDFDDIVSSFHITKLRGPIKTDVIETEFDISTFEYSFRKSALQRAQEKENFK